MSEQIVTFGSQRSLVGVLHRPEFPAAGNDLPAVLLLNAGILHRVGPNRLYVRIARQLEQSGFNVLRFDVWGIGDSQDHTGTLESRTFFDDTQEAMEMLGERIGARRFMIMGICMGAKIALEAARRDPRVDSLVLMEGIYVKSARYHISRILAPEKWRRIFSGESQMVKKVRNHLMKRLGRTSRPTKPAGAHSGASPANPVLFLDDNERNMKRNLHALLHRGAKIMLVFRDGNEIHYNYRLRKTGDDIRAVGLPEGLQVAFIPFADHTFTPLISQELLLNVTMEWVKQRYPNVVAVPVTVAT